MFLDCFCSRPTTKTIAEQKHVDGQVQWSSPNCLHMLQRASTRPSLTALICSDPAAQALAALAALAGTWEACETLLGRFDFEE